MEQAKIIKNNKLIAEFMKWSEAEQLEGGYCVWNESVDQRMPSEMKFYEDWNWLMPVVEKIVDVCFSSEYYWADSEDFYDIRDCVPDIDATYRITVEFIERYNENKEA